MTTTTEFNAMLGAYVATGRKAKTMAQACYETAVKEGQDNSNWNWLSSFIRVSVDNAIIDAYRLRNVLASTNKELKLTITKEGVFTIKQGAAFNKDNTEVLTDIFADGLGMPKKVLTFDDERLEALLARNIKKAFENGFDDVKIKTLFEKAFEKTKVS